MRKTYKLVMEILIQSVEIELVGDRSRVIWPENARGGCTNEGSGDIMRTNYNGGGKGHTHNIATIDVWIWKRTK